VHVQEAEDKQYDGHQADKRKHEQDKRGHAVERGRLPMTPAPGPRKHRERSRRHANANVTAPRQPGRRTADRTYAAQRGLRVRIVASGVRARWPGLSL
jgi:hypothetical protein